MDREEIKALLEDAAADDAVFRLDDGDLTSQAMNRPSWRRATWGLHWAGSREGLRKWAPVILRHAPEVLDYLKRERLGR